MDSFENLIALLLRRDGWWTATSFKVDLTKAEKREIGTHSAPRWELDVVAYKGQNNEVLAIECKSFLDSTGVVYRKGAFEPPDRYKLFAREKTREIVLRRLVDQLVATGSCAPRPTIRLGLATGNIAKRTDRAGLQALFEKENWRLLDDDWVRERLKDTAGAGYENDVAIVVAKILEGDRLAR